MISNFSDVLKDPCASSALKISQCHSWLRPGNFLAGLEIKLATHTNDAGNKLWVGQIPLGTSKDPDLCC